MGARVAQWNTLLVSSSDPKWESWLLLTNGGSLQCNVDQLCVVVSSAHKTMHRDMTNTVLKATLKLK